MQRLLSKIRTIWAEFRRVSWFTFWDSVKIELGHDLGDKRLYRFRNGWTLNYNPRTLDNMVIRECLTNSLYTKCVKQHHLRTVVDLGSHKGFFVLGMLYNGYRFEKLLMVEPLPDNLAAFEENLNMNGRREWSKRIVTENCAVGTSNTTAKFYVTQNSVNHSLIDPSNWDEVVDVVNVRVRTLDEILRRHNIDEIDLLKIDIEGTEFELLQSPQSKSILRAKRIVMEVHQRADVDGEWLRNCLRSHGYRVSFPNPAYKDLVYMERV